jgi:hypothetical protein
LEEVSAELHNNGFNRTLQNIFSLYLKVRAHDQNKSLLNIKPDCSAKDLALIMSEYYNTEASERERLQNFAGLGKRDPAPLVAKLESRFDRTWRPFTAKLGDKGSPKKEREEFGEMNTLKRLKM